ncbi:MAG TPA: DUF2997 domain-containing protein [Allocoleopsis sp.]
MSSCLNHPTVLSQRMETLEFIIYPDGRVLEKVTGIMGNSCAEVTAAIEAQLGQVLTHEPTSEFFAATVQQSATVSTQATFSEW